MRDVFFAVLEMFSIAVLILLAFVIVVNFGDAPIIQGNADASAFVTQTELAFSTYYDVGFLILFVVSFSSMMILGRLLPTHPIFLIPFAFVLLFLIFFVAQVSNWFYEFSTSPELAVYIASFVYIPFVMNNLPILTFVMSLLVGAIVYTGITGQK
jgi:hypothetical protein